MCRQGEQDKRRYQTLLFLRYCYTIQADSNDYAIASVIMRHFHKIHEYSIEQIAEEACISVASVSRFVRKAGFSSFQEMKFALPDYSNRLYARRKLKQTKSFYAKSTDAIADSLLEEARENLESTRRNIPVQTLENVVQNMLRRDYVMIAGDEHELTDFFTLQLDLLAVGISAEMYQDDESACRNIRKMKEGDMLLFLNVNIGFLSKEQRMILETAKERNIYTVIFAQDPKWNLWKGDLFLQYGKEHSSNNGYYSLFYLSQLLSELLYKMDNMDVIQ